MSMDQELRRQFNKATKEVSRLAKKYKHIDLCMWEEDLYYLLDRGLSLEQSFKRIDEFIEEKAKDILSRIEKTVPLYVLYDPKSNEIFVFPCRSMGRRRLDFIGKFN